MALAVCRPLERRASRPQVLWREARRGVPLIAAVNGCSSGLSSTTRQPDWWCTRQEIWRTRRLAGGAAGCRYGRHASPSRRAGGRTRHRLEGASTHAPRCASLGRFMLTCWAHPPPAGWCPTRACGQVLRADQKTKPPSLHQTQCDSGSYRRSRGPRRSERPVSRPSGPTQQHAVGTRADVVWASGLPF